MTRTWWFGPISESPEVFNFFVLFICFLNDFISADIVVLVSFPYENVRSEVTDPCERSALLSTFRNA